MKNLKLNLTIITTIFFLALSFHLNAQSLAYAENFEIDLEATEDDSFKIQLDVDIQGGEVADIYAAIRAKNNFRYISSFEKGLTTKIENVLLQELGQPSENLKNEKNWFRINGKSISNFQIKLKEGRVEIKYLDEDPMVVKQLDKLTKEICKLTYRSKCD